MLDRIKAGEPRQKLVAEMGISMRTLERIVANEAEIRDTAATIQDKSELLPLNLTPDFTYMSGQTAGQTPVIYPDSTVVNAV